MLTFGYKANGKFIPEKHSYKILIKPGSGLAPDVAAKVVKDIIPQWKKVLHESGEPVNSGVVHHPLAVIGLYSDNPNDTIVLIGTKEDAKELEEMLLDPDRPIKTFVGTTDLC